MLARERQNKIVELVNENGSVLVKELANMFKVTEDSIRKDLTLLEKKGFLKKTYGGAIKEQVSTNILLLSKQKEENVKEKKEAAKKAFEIIQERDVIFLDVSAVNVELMKLIMEVNIQVTVVTNMIGVMMAYNPDTKVKLLFIGGLLNKGKDGFTGSYANKQIAEFRFDKAFIGVAGIDIEGNRVYTYTTEGALTKKAIMNSSSKAYMVMENEKFVKNGAYKFSNVDDFAGIMLAKKPDAKILKRIENYPIGLFY